MTQLWKEETSGWVGQMRTSHGRHGGIIPSAGSLGPVSGVTPWERYGCSPEESKAAENLQNRAYEGREKAFVFSLGKARLKGDTITIFKLSQSAKKEEGGELCCIQKLSSVV